MPLIDDPSAEDRQGEGGYRLDRLQQDERPARRYVPSLSRTSFSSTLMGSVRAAGVGPASGPSRDLVEGATVLRAAVGHQRHLVRRDMGEEGKRLNADAVAQLYDHRAFSRSQRAAGVS